MSDAPGNDERRWTLRLGGCNLPGFCTPCIDGKDHEPEEAVEVVPLAALLEARAEIARLKEQK